MNKRVIAGFFIILCMLPFTARGSAIDDLKAEIAQKAQEIKELEEKHKAYQQQLEVEQEKGDSLKYQITKIDTELQGLNLSIKRTQAKIAETTLRIEELGNQIQFKNIEIVRAKDRLRHTLLLLYQTDDQTALAYIFTARNFSDIFSQRQYLANVQGEIKRNLDEIKIFKGELETYKKGQEADRSELSGLSDELKDQKEITTEKKIDKEVLLRQTKNKEKEYQKMIAQLAKQRLDIERETVLLEAKLRAEIDRSKLPTGKGILAWPLDTVRITQHYGKPNWNAAYDFHNGIDLGASTGTPVKAALAGSIIGVGDNGRYSYGKWVAIDHGNKNITTLYGHLSRSIVKIGQQVKTGDVIGYVGSTGYSTGPHLHFTVFASSSYTLLQSTKVPNLLIPIGGSVNPMDYF